jgi:hypothetical protein
MSNEISKLIDLRQTLQEAADEFCNAAERNDGTTDPNDVEKVRHMIEVALHSLDDTPILIDRVSTKMFLSCIAIDRE